jgi:hypothetical protein
MGTVMENIKIALRNPLSVKILPEKLNETEKIVDSKLLYRPV